MITLINAPGLKGITGLQVQSPAPPMGLAYIGAFLKYKGHSYTAIDACGSALDQVRPHPVAPHTLIQGLLPEQILERIPQDTQIFGFSCMFSHNWPLVLEVASAVRKQFPHALIVAGGEHPSAMTKQVLSTRVIDVIVRGEGEETFLALANCVKEKRTWREVEGIAHLDSSSQVVLTAPRKRITAIDDLPWPDWDSWNVEKYIAADQVPGVKGERSIQLMANRGCPFSCTFCSSPQMWTTRYVMRSPKSIVDEMEFHQRKYNVSGFAIMDLTFVVNRRQIVEFTDELRRRQLAITYQLPAGTRCEAFNDDVVQGLAETGLRNLALAPESASDEIRKVIRKQVKLPQMEEAIRRILKTKMNLCVFFVIGFPEDTVDTIKESIRYARRLAWLGVHDVTFSKFTPYPGSQYYSDMEKSGRVKVDYNGLEKMLNFFDAEAESYCPHLSSQQLHRYVLWALFNFYALSLLYRPWRLLNNLWLYFSRGIESTRYMRVFSELFFDRRRWKQASHG